MQSLACKTLRAFAKSVHAAPCLSCASRLTTAAGTKDRANDAALAWVDPANRKDVARVLEIADRAAQRWEVEWTDFLSPPIVADCMAALAGRTDVVCIPWGGYTQAERCRLALGREELLEPSKENPKQLDGVAALQVKGNFMFDPAKHPDFLGAILGTGVVRDKVGDILIQGESSAQILVDPELVEHFEMTLVQVRTVPVETQRMNLDELSVRAPQQEELSSIEASMRLDAIASAGFRISRSKMGELIKAGDVRVNWRAASKPSVEVKAGDIISCTGKGRVEVKVVDMTRKEKYLVTMMRYV